MSAAADWNPGEPWCRRLDEAEQLAPPGGRSQRPVSLRATGR